MIKSFKKHYLTCGKYLLLCGLFAFMSTWRFKEWMPEVFCGDDLVNYISYLDGEFASNLIQSLTGLYADRYRPTFALVLGRLFKVFGDKIELYQYFNIFLHSISALLIFRISFKLSRGNFFASLMIGSLAATSRFAAYQVTQVTGLLEGLGNFFLLAIISLLVEFKPEDIKKSSRLHIFIGCLIGVEFLAIHTHERYVVIIPWMVAMLLWLPASFNLSTSYRKIVIFLTFMPAFFNIVYKKILIKSDFFVATGGSKFQLSLTDISMRAKEAFFSLFGFNYGYSYLTGALTPLELKNFGWQMAVLFTTSWIVLLGIGIKSSYSKAINDKFSKAFRLPAMLLMLAILLLLPAILSIRVENRWLVQPFVLMLLVSAWAIGRLEKKIKKLGLVILMLLSLSSFFIDSVISKSYADLFFVSSAKVAKVIKRDVVDLTLDDNSPIFFLSDPNLCQWILWSGDFFRIYGKGKRPIGCAINEAEIKWVDGGKVFSVDPLKGASDVTNDFLSRRDNRL